MKKQLHKLIRGLAMLALTLLSYTSVSATDSGAESSLVSNTYYVSPMGNDINACTLAAPCKTFTRAMNLAAVGDTVIIAAGNYPQQVTISKPLTLKANGIVTTLGFIIRADNVTIDGFDITSPRVINGSFGIRVFNANCHILNNYIHDTVLDGILLDGTSNGCLVENNRIERPSQSGIEVRGTNHVIENNEIWNTIQFPPELAANSYWQGVADADGMRFFGSGHVFRNNYIHDIVSTPNPYRLPHIDCWQTWADSAPRLTAHDIRWEGNRCFLSWEGTKDEPGKVWQLGGGPYNLTMINNITRTRMVAIVMSGAHDVSFTHNTFIGSGSLSWGFEVDGGTSKITVTDNIFQFQQNGYGFLHVASNVTLVAGRNCGHMASRGTRPLDSGDVWGLDPLFVNLSNDDFHLQSNSPCAGIGANISSPPTTMPSPTPTPIGTSTSIPVTITSSPTPTIIVSSPTPLPLPTNTLETTATSVPPTETATGAPTETAAPSTEVVYDNTDASFIYSPEWTEIANKKAYGTSYKETSTNGASVTFTFTGQSFSILYTGGPAFRNMDVYVDDILVGSINQKADVRTYQLRWDYTGQLEPGTHVLKLVYVTPKATNTKGALDAVIIR